MGHPGLTFDGDPAPRTGQVSLVIAAFLSSRLLVTRKAGKGSGNQHPFYPCPQVPRRILSHARSELEEPAQRGPASLAMAEGAGLEDLASFFSV